MNEQLYRCRDCANSFPEDEVDILRSSPVDKGYLACLPCIQTARERYKRQPDHGWMEDRFRAAEYRAQDFEQDHGLHTDTHERLPVAQTIWQWFASEFAYFFLSYD